MKFLLLLTLISICSAVEWEIYYYNTTSCEQIYTETCFQCGNDFYEIQCGKDGPKYDYWSNGITTASDCAYYQYENKGCTGTYYSLAIQAYSYGENVCDKMNDLYDGSFCKFGATTPSYDPLDFFDYIIIFLLITSLLIFILIIFSILLYGINRRRLKNEEQQFIFDET